MNKTKIEWADMTWNPVVGCKHGCKYCYAQRIAKRFGGYDKGDGTITTYNPLPRAELSQPLTITQRNGKKVNSPFPFGFEPTLLYYRLEEPQSYKKPQNIFVCSMADLFGAWVPDEWIVEVFAACRKAPQHRYLFLTKNPKRYIDLAEAGQLPENDNMWYGTTITDGDAPYFYCDAVNTFISIEPLLGHLNPKHELMTDWIIVGAMTGQGSKNKQPSRREIENIIQHASLKNTPVFMKNSLIPIVGEENMCREFPWQRKMSARSEGGMIKANI